MGISDIQAVNVEHCNGAKAVSVTFPNGFKFSYSGDCRPSEAFAYIGKGTTVLLHEATFDDELQGDAIAKKHSTTSEALAVGAEMEAKYVLLTHFSQRYQKIPIMDEDENDNFSSLETRHERSSATVAASNSTSAGLKFGIMFDYMRVKVGDIAHLEKLNPALVELFKTAEEEDKEAVADDMIEDGNPDTKKKNKSSKRRN